MCLWECIPINTLQRHCLNSHDGAAEYIHYSRAGFLCVCVWVLTHLYVRTCLLSTIDVMWFSCVHLYSPKCAISVSYNAQSEHSCALASRSSLFKGNMMHLHVLKPIHTHRQFGGGSRYMNAPRLCNSSTQWSWSAEAVGERHPSLSTMIY